MTQLALVEPATRERPILMSGPLVAATLDGRKTVTRRIVKLHGAQAISAERIGMRRAFDRGLTCPYGRPGDRLWVRETFAVIWNDAEPCECPADRYCCQHEHVEYRADTGAPAPGEWPADDPGRPRWRPSIHMPRVCSRLDLEVVDVSIERVQAITVADVWREGVQIPAAADDGRPLLRLTGKHPPSDYLTRETVSDTDAFVRAHFASLWDQINASRHDGAYAWARDPWVWRVEYRKL